MKQTEVETKLIEVKSKWADKIAEFKGVVNDIEERRVNLGREIAEKHREHSMLRQQVHLINTQIMKMEQERAKELAAFKSEHYSEERKLSEVSDWCLVNELVARGFTGDINHADKEVDFMAHLKAKFSGDKYITPPSIAGDIPLQLETQES